MSVEAGEITTTPCFKALPQTTIYIDAHMPFPVILNEDRLKNEFAGICREFAYIAELFSNIVSNKLRWYYVHKNNFRIKIPDL